MASLHKVTVFGASGKFGTPITAALIKAGFDVSVISRQDSTAEFPPGIRVTRVPYTLDELTKALAGQDAVVCAVGPAGISLQPVMVDAAEAAGVKRFVLDDFGWGPYFKGLPEFADVKKQRAAGPERARALAEKNPGFTWSSVATGNPIDWALKRFPLMGFDISKKSAIIYDSGTEYITGTTLEGIGQAIVGVLQHPEETKNRCLKAMSIGTCQNDLLEAFRAVTGEEWEVKRNTTQELYREGQEKREQGDRTWVWILSVTQLYLKDQGLGRVATSWEASDSALLGVVEVSPKEVVASVMGL